MRVPSLDRPRVFSGLRPLVVAAVLVGITAGCDQGRSRARISTLERTTGGAVTEWRFEYADDGRLDEIRIESGGAVQTIAYTYDEDTGAVLEIATTDDDGDVYLHEFEWEQGQIVQKRESGGGVTARTDLEHDDLGRPVHAEKLTEFGTETRIERVTTLEYDDEGRLSEWLDTVTTTVEVIFIGDVVSNQTYERELEYDDDSGALEVIRLSVRTGDNVDISEVEYDYDADTARLAEVIDESNDQGDLDYDDQGRIESIDFRDDDDRYTFEYEEGSTSSVVLEPFGIPYSMFFDLAGRSFSTIDFSVGTALLGL